MPEIDRARLAARTQSQYDGFGYSSLFAGDLNAAAAVANDVAGSASGAAGAAAAASNSLAAALAIVGGAQGVGSDPFEVPRVVDLGSAAFFDADVIRGQWPVARGAAYQILPTDYGLTLIAETGTLTWTLPLLSFLPDGWWGGGWNRSGATLTINRTSPDVIGAAATSVTAADGAGLLLARRNATRFERIA